MKWKQYRRSWEAESDDGGEIGYVVSRKRNGKFFIKGYRPGGAEIRLPYQDYETPEEAMEAGESNERKRAEYRHRHEGASKIRF